MTYINLTSMEWPFYQGDVELDPDGVYAPLVDEPPMYDHENQKLVVTAPQEVNGQWVVQYRVEPLTEEDIVLKEALAQEDARLRQELDALNKPPAPTVQTQDLSHLSGSAPNVIG